MTNDRVHRSRRTAVGWVLWEGEVLAPLDHIVALSHCYVVMLVDYQFEYPFFQETIRRGEERLVGGEPELGTEEWDNGLGDG